MNAREGFYCSAWDGWGLRLKRAMDVIVSATMLVALCPLMLVIGVAIKVTSPGPAFFVQDRLGRGRLSFRIYKFRTMVTDAEARLATLRHLNEMQWPAFKLKGDPRITPIGVFLRKTSLDELPQLVNVLLGNMSLVGPRPLQLDDHGGIFEELHRQRFCVKPGLTCLWQVKGRSTIGFEEWMALDLRYIEQWSVWLDLKILAMTIPAVLSGWGAM